MYVHEGSRAQKYLYLKVDDDYVNMPCSFTRTGLFNTKGSGVFSGWETEKGRPVVYPSGWQITICLSVLFMLVSTNR